MQAKSEDLFKYLLVKSIADTFLTLFLPLNSLHIGQYMSQTRSIAFNLICGQFLPFSLQLISMLCEVAACFNRYRSSIGKFKLFDNISYKFTIVAMLSYSFGFYSYKFVSKKIVQVQDYNGSETSYEMVPTDLDKTMGYIHSFVRDGACVLIIIVLNMLTAIEIRCMFVKKKLLLKSSKSERVQSAKTRLAIMVFVMSALALVGHGLTFLAYLNPKNEFFWEKGCYQSLTSLLYWFSYEINFFLYYAFNLNFQRIVNFYLGQLLFTLGFKVNVSTGIQRQYTLNSRL